MWGLGSAATDGGQGSWGGGLALKWEGSGTGRFEGHLCVADMCRKCVSGRTKAGKIMEGLNLVQKG